MEYYVTYIKGKKYIYDSEAKKIIQHGLEIWQVERREESKLSAKEMDFWRTSNRTSK